MAESPLKRSDWFLAAALAGLTIAAGACRIAPGVCGLFHDDAIYVSTAKGLAQGDGYRLVDVPGEPLQTKYPILYPALLAGVWKARPDFPGNLAAMQGLTLVSAGGTIGLAFLYLVRFGYFSRPLAASAGMVCATAPFFLYFAVQTMAEMPFALLMVAALWGAERAKGSGFMVQGSGVRGQESEGTKLTADSRLLIPWSQLALGFLLALPFLCRTIGATFVVASLWVLWLNRRPVKWYAIGAACAAAPWIVWSLLGRGIWEQNRIEGYYTDYFGCWTSTGLSLAGRVFFTNALLVAQGSCDLSVEGASAALQSAVGRQPAFFVLMIVGLSPWLAMIPDLVRRRALPWILVAYLGAMLLWPWPPQRFLVPILPLLIPDFLSVPAAILKPWREMAAGRLVAAVAVGSIVLANGALLLWHQQVTREYGTPLARASETPVPWGPYERTFAWLRKNSQPREIVATWFDSMAALYSGRQSIRPFAYDPGPLFYGNKQSVEFDPEVLAATLAQYGTRYFVQTPLPGCAEDEPLRKVVQELRLRHPQWLELAYQDADSRFIVFRLDPQHAPLAQQPVGWDKLASASAGPPISNTSSGGLAIAAQAGPTLGNSPDREVIVFLGTECPMARLYVPRLNDLAERYPQVRFRGLNASNQDSAEEVAAFGRRLRFPYEKDDGTLARRLSATRSPEAFLLVGGRIVYRGRIDDQYTPGTNRGSPTRCDLEEAIKEVLAARPVSIPSTQATGCRLSLPVKPVGEITYDDVAPILHQKCAECHRPGQVAPFPLLTYDDTVGWGAMIEEVVRNGRMPPWHADPAHGHFANDRSLTTEQKELLLAWTSSGSPPGKNPPQAPAFDDGWQIRPDRILSMDRYFAVPAEGVLDYQEFTIDPGFKQDTWVQGLEVRPGNRAVVHHINVLMRPPGARPNTLYLNQVQDVYLATAVPGNLVTFWPEGIAKRIPAGWNFVLSVHYQPNGTVQTDRSQVALQLASRVRQQVASRVFVDLDMVLPPQKATTVSKRWTLEDDFTLYALYPHMHLRGKSMIFEIISPQREVLLDVPRYDFNWQHRYVLSEPRKLAKGTVIECRAVFDNTAANPHNPDPQATVRFGPQSTDEMFQACFEVVRTNEDLARWNWPPLALLSLAAVLGAGFLISRFWGQGPGARDQQPGDGQ